MDYPAVRDSSLHPDVVDEPFDESRSPSPVDPSDNDTAIVEDIDNYSTRELRPQRRGLQPTTWLDKDTSGNYDPAQERMMRRARPRTAPRTRAPGDQNRERVPVEKPRLIGTITFTSAEAKEKFSTVISQIQVQEAADQEGYKLRTRTRDERSGTPDIHIDLTAKPFARGCVECAATIGSSGQSQCSLLHDERHWPCLTCQEDGHDCEMIVHPARKRQCEACKRRKVPCSYTYTKNHGVSCSQCESVGLPCVAGPDFKFLKQRIRLDRDWEKDPLPTKKKGKLRANEECWECSQAGTACSYECEDDGSGCEACKQNGSPCTIGTGPPPQPKPRQSRKRKRDVEKETNRVDAEAGTPNTAEQEGVTPEEKDETPKDARKDSAIDVPRPFRMPNSCNPHAIAAAKKREQDAQRKQDAENSLPSPPSSSSQQSWSPSQPIHHHRPRGQPIFRKISTSFCHPIEFNCDIGPDEGGTSKDTSTPCDFCAKPYLALHGLGRKKNVEVIDFQNDSPYTETHNGHFSLGESTTRVCLECTTARANILFCMQHTMVAIPGTDYTDDELDAAMRDVEDCVNLRNVFDYCALCGHLAQYECQNEQEPCGLSLCAGCAETMVDDHASNLQHMLSHSWHEPTAEAPLGLRADAELLDAKRGTLMRFVRSLKG